MHQPFHIADANNHLADCLSYACLVSMTHTVWRTCVGGPADGRTFEVPESALGTFWRDPKLDEEMNARSDELLESGIPLKEAIAIFSQEFPLGFYAIQNDRLVWHPPSEKET